MDKSFDLEFFLKKHEKHKKKPEQFKSVARGVKKRLEDSIKYRKSSRLSHLDSIRNLVSIEIPKPISEFDKKVEHRRMQMEKWKEEKERKKREAAAQKKKPFLTGIAHPPLKYEPPPPLATMPSTSGRVTRSQTSKASRQWKTSKLSKTTESTKSFAPPNASFKPPKIKNLTVLPELVPVDKLNKLKKKKINISFDPVVYDLKKKTGLSNSEGTNIPIKLTTSNIINQSKSKQKDLPIKVTKTAEPVEKILHSSSDNVVSSRKIVNEKTPKRRKHNADKIVMSKDTTPNTPRTLEQLTDPRIISPRVTRSRGKDSARKEMKKKMEEGNKPENEMTMDDDNRNIEVESFKIKLASEVERIIEMCDQWETISQQVSLSESAMEVLLSAVGQGRLLVSQKLAQFRSLIASCEHPEPGATLVTPADLHGFWDMVYMQVENVDMRFKKLADLRDRNWEEEVQIIPTRKRATVGKNKVKPAATSRLRDVISAARKAKKEQGSLPEEDAQNEHHKTFDAGFFSVRSPVKPPKTPSKPSLLKDVLSNEANK